tara:strand:- start:1528 stop:1881 length:354 start_codon:yes stop_codon:yes gene_type:complete
MRLCDRLRGLRSSHVRPSEPAAPIHPAVESAISPIALSTAARGTAPFTTAALATAFPATTIAATRATTTLATTALAATLPTAFATASRVAMCEHSGRLLWLYAVSGGVDGSSQDVSG